MEYIALAIIVLIILLLIYKKWYVILVAYLINLSLLPLGYVFGMMGAGAPDGNIFDFLMGFVYLQAVPIILLIASIIYTVVVHKRKKQQA